MAVELVLIVQVVTVLWTKRTLRSPQAAQLETLPEQWPLPIAGAAGGALLCHRLGLTENNGFAIPEAAWRVLPWQGSHTEASLRLQQFSDQLTVRLGPLEAWLDAGQWGRVTASGRWRDHQQVRWVYYRRTWNVAWQPPAVDAALFTAGEPRWWHRVEG